jgi:hypothetical protein
LNIFIYLKKNHNIIYNQLNYFLNSDQCTVFGGFVKYILIDEVWNKELDILCYDYENIKKDFIAKFPPDSIEDMVVHTILTYGDYKIDLCKQFVTNDFSFNSLGLIGENIVVIPNIFGTNINYFLDQFDKKIGYAGRFLKNPILRENKYKNWKIIKEFKTRFVDKILY